MDHGVTRVCTGKSELTGFPSYGWVTLRLLQFGGADCRVAVRMSECDRGVSVTSTATAAATVSSA